MPFMSYQTSPYDAVVNAGRLMKEGHANMVKIRRWKRSLPTDRSNSKSINSCLRPFRTYTTVNKRTWWLTSSGEKRQKAMLRKLIDDAKAVQEAGAQC